MVAGAHHGADRLGPGLRGQTAGDGCRRAVGNPQAPRGWRPIRGSRSRRRPVRRAQRRRPRRFRAALLPSDLLRYAEDEFAWQTRTVLTRPVAGFRTDSGEPCGTMPPSRRFRPASSYPMPDALAAWHGLYLLPAWGYALLALGLTHATIVAVTLYLHRDQAHRSLRLSAPARHACRFWLWLTTGMVTREWVAVHRKHHARVETADDPHSPAVRGLRAVLWSGVELYRREAACADTLRRYGGGAPDDWLERHLYARRPAAGMLLLLGAQLLLFGLPGLAVWAVQMLWIPLFAAGVINGLGHAVGYRNFDTPDRSSNLGWLGLLIGGEELHNNHHAYPRSARFSMRRFELDIGWLYIRALRALRLAEVRGEAPRLRLAHRGAGIDLDTARALVDGRIMILGRYAREVLAPAVRQEARRGVRRTRRLCRQLRRALLTMECRRDRARVQRLLAQLPRLREVFRYQRRLRQILHARNLGYQVLGARLAEWCAEADATGIELLQRFAGRLRRYSLQPA